MTIRIGNVYPELLGTYGDYGNALVLYNRLTWRGIDAAIVAVSPGDALPPDLDYYLLGGGEDAAQVMAAELLMKNRAALDAAIGNGATALAICAGFQLLGNSYLDANGRKLAGLGLIDMETRAGNTRAIGELVVECIAAASPRGGSAGLNATLSGYENHGGRSVLADPSAALGRVVAGEGNDSTVDGYFRDNIVGTYMHGPFLARNPDFADHLLQRSVSQALEPLDDRVEIALRAERIRVAKLGGWRRWLYNKRLAAAR